MKNHYIWGITLCIMITLMYNQSNAQFLAAANADNAAGLSNVWPYNTGNDILDDGSDIYRVSVWSETSNPGISWKVTISSNDYTGNAGFGPSSDIDHADVCLLKDIGNNEICAIVGWYYSGTSPGTPSWGIDEYRWDNSNSTFVLQNNGGITVGGSYGTTVNVDADENGHFIMVYDDNSGNIYSLTGSENSGFSINNSGTPCNFGVSSYSYPDISLFWDGTNEIAYLAYIDNVGDVMVKRNQYSSITGGSPSTAFSAYGGFPTTTPAFGYNNSNTRIASPNSSGAAHYWTVVWQEDDRYTYYIKGINCNNATPSSVITYNDGTFINPGSAIDLTGVPNQFPVVAYDGNSTPNIWIGWQFDNSNGYYNDPSSGYTGIVDDSQYPIGFKCDDTAIPITSTDYWIVPYTVYDAGVLFLSLASRFTSTSDELFATFWSGYNYDVYSKNFASSGASSFRQPALIYEANEQTGFDRMLNRTDQHEISLLKIFDSNGTLVFEGRGKFEEFSTNFDLNFRQETAGIYFLQAFSEDGKQQLKRKFLIR